MSKHFAGFKPIQIARIKNRGVTRAWVCCFDCRKVHRNRIAAFFHWVTLRIKQKFNNREYVA